jgi:site-specific DNA recombinase
MEEGNLIEEKEGLIQDLNGELSKGQEVSNLIKYTNKTAMLTAFDDEAFTQHMDRIIVFSREEIGFVLKCGITLRERM